jgi:hypothetical protein
MSPPNCTPLYTVACPREMLCLIISSILFSYKRNGGTILAATVDRCAMLQQPNSRMTPQTCRAKLPTKCCRADAFSQCEPHVGRPRQATHRRCLPMDGYAYRRADHIGADLKYLCMWVGFARQPLNLAEALTRYTDGVVNPNPTMQNSAEHFQPSPRASATFHLPRIARTIGSNLCRISVLLPLYSVLHI